MSCQSTIVDLTRLIQTQRAIVEQHQVPMDTEHDAFDATLLAHNRAKGLKEQQMMVVKTCSSSVKDAQTVLDLDTLEDEKAQLKTLETLANTAGDSIVGPHFSFEDACEVYTTVDSYLRYLEESFMTKMRQFRDLDLA